jgi:hypothetical protein
LYPKVNRKRTSRDRPSLIPAFVVCDIRLDQFNPVWQSPASTWTNPRNQAGMLVVIVFAIRMNVSEWPSGLRETGINPLLHFQSMRALGRYPQTPLYTHQYMPGMGTMPFPDISVFMDDGFAHLVR